jgi:hypothetical protein
MSGRDRLAVRICAGVQTRSERCLGKILDFFGIESRTVDVGSLATVDPSTVVGGSSYSVFVSAAHLASVAGQQSGLPPLLRSALSVFVFGFDDSPVLRRVLGWLTGRLGTGCTVRRVSGTELVVTADSQDMFGALSGLTASRTAADDGVAVHGASGCEGFRSLIGDGAGDVFFQCRREGLTISIAASEPAVDIDEPVRGSFFDVRDCFGSVVPLVAFLRREFATAFGGPETTGATLIVDDPSLKRRYGSLDFETVLAAMDHHDFSTTVAFIPWNWWRTRARTAALFRDHARRYSLAIHGCDHTAREFGTRSRLALGRKIRLALQRAERHRQRTGLGVSPIMVFPQGVFSADAALALQHSRFIAAVNTDVHPVGDDALRTEVRELWRVAITKYGGFPIFTRRYLSHGIENVAFDTLLGKPCLLVAHHDVFSDGARDLLSFIDRLNALAQPLRWSSLEDVIHHSYLAHRISPGARHVRMFANEMVLHNHGPNRETVVVTRAPSSAAIGRVTCDGRDLQWQQDGREVRFELEVPAGSPVRVCVEHDEGRYDDLPAESLRYRGRVLARRYLSEMRDDYVSRNRYVRDYADRLMRSMK